MPGRERDAFELAVRAISRRERTVSEVRDWLAAREVPPEKIDEALDRLVEAGGLDDERYARLFAEDKVTLSGWGPERIRDALLKKGIERRTAEAVTSGESHADQAERAAGLIERRGDDLGDERGRGRALSFLARRGYDLEVAYEAVRVAERRRAT